MIMLYDDEVTLLPKENKKKKKRPKQITQKQTDPHAHVTHKRAPENHPTTHPPAQTPKNTHTAIHTTDSATSKNFYFHINKMGKKAKHIRALKTYLFEI